MERKIRLVVSVLLLLLVLGALVSCNRDEEPKAPVVVSVYDNYSTADPEYYTLVGTSYLSLTVPQREGYVFAGYYDSSVGGVQIIDADGKQNVMIMRDMRLYAQWTPKTYSIRFAAGEGQLLSSPDTVDYQYGAELSVFPIAEREGYDFMGWAVDGELYCDPNGAVLEGFNEFVDGEKYSIFSAEGVTLHAVWEKKQLTVTFDCYDGSYITETFQVYYGDSFSLSDFPSMDTGSKEIAGWSYSTVSKELIDTDITDIKSDITVYAVWRDYKLVKFVETADSFKMIKVYKDTPYVPYIPDCEGYTFDGWYTSAAFAGNPVETIQYHDDKDVYYARLDVLSYILYIKENNVNVTVKRNDTKQEVSSGSAIPYGTSLTISCATNSGYKNGWTSPSGTITMPAKDLTINSGATLITSSSGGGSGDSDTKSCLVKGTPILLPDGSTVPIETLKVGDAIMTFDHVTGMPVESVVGYTYYAFGEVYVIDLVFANGISLGFVNTGHGLYDMTLERYVLITPENVAQYVGHRFAYINESFETEAVELTAYSVSVELIERYDVVSANHLNHIANGMLACSDTLVGFSNTFEFNSLVYDIEQMEKDIEAYGLYSYDEWSQYVTVEEFAAFNGHYFKIALAKGLLTEEELFGLISDVRSLWS